MTVRNAPSCSPRTSLRSRAKLGGYLAAGLGASVLGTAESEAGVVTLDLGPTGFNVLGPNAGVASGSYRGVAGFPFAGGPTLKLYNGYGSDYVGVAGSNLSATNQLEFAFLGSEASPQRFGANTAIDASADFTTYLPSLFRLDTYTSPDFGASSYLGFRVLSGTDYYYGYLEATWSASTDTFELLSGAYESTPNTAITTPAAVPEPSAIALTGIGALALGAGAIRRSRKARKESLAAAV